MVIMCKCCQPGSFCQAQRAPRSGARVVERAGAKSNGARTAGGAFENRAAGRVGAHQQCQLGRNWRSGEPAWPSGAMASRGTGAMAPNAPPSHVPTFPLSHLPPRPTAAAPRPSLRARTRQIDSPVGSSSTIVFAPAKVSSLVPAALAASTTGRVAGRFQDPERVLRVASRNGVLVRWARNCTWET
jgi:hypothetical protein